MKKIDSYYFGIGMNDYEVKVITNDNLDIRRVIAKEDIKEDDYNVKANEEIKLTDEDKKFFEEGLKEEFSAVNIGGIYCELPVDLPVKEMTLSEKKERLGEIEKLLKSLAAERKEILNSLEVEKPLENTSNKNNKLEDMSVDELKNSKSIDELIKEALNSKETANGVVDNAMNKEER